MPWWGWLLVFVFVVVPILGFAAEMFIASRFTSGAGISLPGMGK